VNEIRELAAQIMPSSTVDKRDASLHLKRAQGNIRAAIEEACLRRAGKK